MKGNVTLNYSVPSHVGSINDQLAEIRDSLTERITNLTMSKNHVY